MGGFLSKAPQELESAEKISDATNVQSVGERKRKKDLVEIKETGDDLEKQLLIIVLIGSVLHAGATTISTIVSDKYWRYVTAKNHVEISTKAIKNLQECPESIQDRYWQKNLNSWESKREAAVAFMKKHKYIGKLVEMFPPNLEAF